jgi:hypothetical protein
MVLQSLVIFLAVNTPADDEGLSAFFDVHKMWGGLWGNRTAKPIRTAPYFQVYIRKNSAVRMCLIPKSLTSAYLPTNGLTPTRTGDLIDVNDAL